MAGSKTGAGTCGHPHTTTGDPLEEPLAASACTYELDSGGQEEENPGWARRGGGGARINIPSPDLRPVGAGTAGRAKQVRREN